MTPPFRETLRAEMDSLLDERAQETKNRPRRWDSQTVFLVAMAIAGAIWWGAVLQTRVSAQGETIQEIKMNVQKLVEQGRK